MFIIFALQDLSKVVYFPYLSPGNCIDGCVPFDWYIAING